MSKIWKLGVRAILALAFTGILMFVSGCGDDDGVSTDTTPDAFSFTAQTVALSTLITSNAITVAGINSPAPISITGGTYSIDGGTYTSTAGTVTNGQTVTVQHTSSAANSTVTTTTLTIGGVSASFTSTTVAAGVDITPDVFSFTAQTGVALSTVITSNVITVAGINSPAPISITGGTYSINGGAYTAIAGTVTNGQTVTVRHTSSAANSTVTTTTLTIGGVSASFTSTTVAAAGGGLTITTTTLPAATFGTAYSQALAATGGTTQYTWALVSGTLPAGLTLSALGAITGTPTAPAVPNATPSNFTVGVTDTGSGSGTAPLAITASLSASASSGKTFYDANCAGCHNLGIYDTTGGDPNLGTTTLAAINQRFSASTHQGRTMTATQITDMFAFVSLY